MQHPVNRREFLVSGAALLVGTGLPADAAPLGIEGNFAGRKRALLVAVNGYKRPGQEHPVDLNTLPDVNKLEAVLKHLHFDEIVKLHTKEQTTRKGIMDALKSLVETAMDGDVLYFHYSGHGSQVPDANDPLGFDETLVPSDYVSAKDGSRDIKDKEIAAILRAGLAGKNVASFLLTFDSCHSGTITRDAGTALNRGFPRDIPGNPMAREKKRAELGGIISSQAAAAQGFTVISACRSDQRDFETTDDDKKPMGSLTYAISKALASAGPETTYGDLFEQVTDIYRAKGLFQQDPQMEGRLDVALLGGGVVRRDPYIEVEVDGNSVALLAGTLMGVTEGTKIALAPQDVRVFKPGMEIAECTITAPGATRCALKPIFRAGKGFKDLHAAHAFITERRYTDAPVRVDTSLLRQHPQREAIVEALGALEAKGVIKTHGTEKNWDVQITPAREVLAGQMDAKPRGDWDRWEATLHTTARGVTAPRTLEIRGSDPRKPDTLMMLRSDGSLLYIESRTGTYVQAVSPESDLPALITESLRRESRHRLLTSLTAKPGSGRIHVSFRITLCEVDPAANGKFKWRKDIGVLSPSAGNAFRASAGSFFRLELRNDGRDEAFVTLVDLAPDGSIGPLWPNPTIGKVDNRIPPTAKWIPLLAETGSYTLWQFTEPLGSETFMAIATPTEANFAPLFDPVAIGQRGAPRSTEAQSPLGRLFIGATTRNATAVSEVPDNWQASSIHLTIEGGTR